MRYAFRFETQIKCGLDDYYEKHIPRDKLTDDLLNENLEEMTVFFLRFAPDLPRVAFQTVAHLFDFFQQACSTSRDLSAQILALKTGFLFGNVFARKLFL